MAHHFFGRLARRAMQRDELRSRRDRGAVAAFVAISSVTLLAGAGLGLDTSNAAFRRGQVQHAADAAALAIAADCAMGRPSCTPSGNATTADYFADQNAPGADLATPVIPATGDRVTVTVAQDVDNAFMGVVGADTTRVEGVASAKWGGHPVAGHPPLPLAVPYCQYYANRPAVATSDLLLRTDLVDKVLTLLGGITNLLLPVLELTNDLTSGGAAATQCTGPAGSDMVQLQGPVWLTGLSNVLGSVFSFLPSTCETTIGDLSTFTGAELSSAIAPSACIAKLGTSIKVGDTIMLPIYVPKNNDLKLGIVNLGTCINLSLSSLLRAGGCVSVPPKLGVDIVGYAPFKISGWSFPGNSQNAPACTQLISVQVTLSLLGIPLINTATSVGCNGLLGRFVNTVVPDPNFQYSTSGPNYGAYYAALTE